MAYFTRILFKLVPASVYQNQRLITAVRPEISELKLVLKDDQNFTRLQHCYLYSTFVYCGCLRAVAYPEFSAKYLKNVHLDERNDECIYILNEEDKNISWPT